MLLNAICIYSTSKGERNQTVKVSYCKEGEVKITLYMYCYSGEKQSLMILLPEFFLNFFLVKFFNWTMLRILLFFNLLHTQLGELVWIFFFLFFRFKNHTQWWQQATGTTCKQDKQTCESLGDKIVNKKGIISPSPKKRKRMHVS